MSLSHPSMLTKAEEGTIRALPRSTVPMCTVRMDSFFTVLSLVSVCSLPSIAYTLLKKKEKGKSLIRAFQINSLVFEQGSG